MVAGILISSDLPDKGWGEAERKTMGRQASRRGQETKERE